MDILRKELGQIYAAQALDTERLPEEEVMRANRTADTFADVGDGCAVVTDASCDHCYIHTGSFGALMGFMDESRKYAEEDSSDEDRIYTRIHPEDLVDKRLLEYEFFKLVDRAPADARLSYKATCRLRIKDVAGQYRYVDNTTRLIRLSPAGKIWLILCTYDLSSDLASSPDISPCMVNTHSGVVTPVILGGKRTTILSKREKEVLQLIGEGYPSKQIADRLHISVYTVSRNRQNILAKLSVGNSIEAFSAAKAMRLL